MGEGVRNSENIYSEGELSENATSAKFAQVQMEGGRSINREIFHYNLDAIQTIGCNAFFSKVYYILMNQLYKRVQSFLEHNQLDISSDQFFCVDGQVLDALVDIAQITQDDRVLETGPGLGFVTTRSSYQRCTRY